MTDKTSPEPAASTQPALVRHIIPVVVGGAVAVLLTFVTDNSLAGHGVLPSPDHPVFAVGPLLLTAAYRAVFLTLGCHMAARLAPDGQPRIRYALALGMLMLVLNVIGAVSLQGQVPMWFSLLGIALPVPCAIFGGGSGARAVALRQDGAART